MITYSVHIHTFTYITLYFYISFVQGVRRISTIIVTDDYSCYKKPKCPYNFFLILIFNKLFTFKTSDEWQHWKTGSSTLGWKEIKLLFTHSHRSLSFPCNIVKFYSTIFHVTIFSFLVRVELLEDILGLYVNARFANYMVCIMYERWFLEFPDPSIFFLTYYACFVPLESVFLFPWVFRYSEFNYLPHLLCSACVHLLLFVRVCMSLLCIVSHIHVDCCRCTCLILVFGMVA